MRCPRAGASGEHESMKSRETLIRLKKFQVEERRRRVAQIEGMISEFERISGDLERDIKVEQDRSGIHDPGHFAYPTYAKAAIQRRDNLRRSADDLKAQLEDAKAALGEAFEEMRKVELLGERDQMRERPEEDEQAELDAVGMMRNSASAQPSAAAQRRSGRSGTGRRVASGHAFRRSPSRRTAASPAIISALSALG